MFMFLCAGSSRTRDVEIVTTTNPNDYTMYVDGKLFEHDKDKSLVKFRASENWTSFHDDANVRVHALSMMITFNDYVSFMGTEPYFAAVRKKEVYLGNLRS